MKTLESVLENYNEYETFLDDRFGSRLIQFLTEDQIKQIGFRLKEGVYHQPIEFTEENILKQLKRDVEFGWEKCLDHRGISSGLMADVVVSWCKVLENKFKNLNTENEDYGYYGNRIFKLVNDYYDFGIISEEEYEISWEGCCIEYRKKCESLQIGDEE